MVDTIFTKIYTLSSDVIFTIAFTLYHLMCTTLHWQMLIKLQHLNMHTSVNLKKTQIILQYNLLLQSPA